MPEPQKECLVEIGKIRKCVFLIASIQIEDTIHNPTVQARERYTILPGGSPTTCEIQSCVSRPRQSY